MTGPNGAATSVVSPSARGASRRRVEVLGREGGFLQGGYDLGETAVFSAVKCRVSVDDPFDLAGV